MTELVVFDLFNTLVTPGEPLPPTAGVVELVAARTGAPAETITPVVERLITDLLHGATTPDRPQPATDPLVADALAAIGPDLDPALADTLLWEALGPAAAPYAVTAGVMEVLGELRARGVCARILTNTILPGRLVERLLRDLGLLDQVDRFRASGDGGPKKPQAEAFRTIGAGPFQRRLMVGDTPDVDLATPAHLGWEVLLYDGPEAWDSVLAWTLG